MFDNIKQSISKFFVKKGYNLFGLSRLSNYNLNWQVKDYLRAFEASPYVFTCVRKRAEKVGQIKFKLFYSNTDKEITDQNNWVIKLLNKPNPFLSKNEFFELYQTYKDLAGSAYMLKLPEFSDEVQELHLLRPDWISGRLMDSETGLIRAYKYRTPNGREFVFDAENIIVSHYPNPTDPFNGISLIKASALAIDTGNQLMIYHNKVLKNGGKVEGVLNYQATEMTQEQIDEIREMFKAQYADANNAGKPLVTFGGAKYENLGLSPTELSYIESLKFTRDDILMIFGTPKEIIALGETGSLGGTGYEGAKRVFLSETIKPLLDNLIEKLNYFLVPDEWDLQYVDPTPEDIEVKLKQIASGGTYNYLKINEMRQLAGFEPIDDGDVILIPFSLAPLSQMNDPEPVADPNADDPNAQKGLKKQFIHPLSAKTKREKYFQLWFKTTRKREAIFLRKMRSLFKEQQTRLINKVERVIPKKLKGVNDYFDKRLEIAITEKLVVPIMEKFYKESAEESFKIFDVDKPYNLNSRDKTTILKRAGMFANDITETTIAQLQSQFNQSLENGEDRGELIGRIKDTFGQISKGRANVIARTEVLVSEQSGKFAGYKDIGIPIKIWVSVRDDATRESHAEIDGEEQNINDHFSNGLMFPGDPTGEAGEVINCRCTI
jgi:HK97 family phage portal protein